MNITTHIPENTLRYAIRLIRLVEKSSSFHVTFFPTGYPFIVSAVDAKISLTKNDMRNNSHTFLCGVTNQLFDMTMPNAERILIVQFQPWILSKLFPFSALDFLNYEIPLAEVDCDLTASIEDALVDLDPPDSVITSIGHLIRKKLNFKFVDPRVFSAWQMMLMQKGNIKIKDVANAVNLSNRRLEQLFKEHIGFTPKNYQRVVRIQSSIYDHVTTNQVKLETPYGYFDQAHYIKEVNTLMGMTPTELSAYLQDPIQKATSLDSNIYSSAINF